MKFITRSYLITQLYNFKKKFVPNNKSVLEDLSDNNGVLNYKNSPISSIGLSIETIDNENLLCVTFEEN